MKLSDLKEQVLHLANVKNSQELKRSYSIARSLNLSYKKSWEDLLVQFQQKVKPEHKRKLNMGELKAHVLKLADVATVKQLKKKYAPLKPLNFRYYSTWETALSNLEHPNLEDSEFQDWLKSPSEEYRELFKEIKDVSHSLDQSIKKGNKLGKKAQRMANNMVSLAKEAQTEVDIIKKEIVLAKKTRPQAELN